MDKFQYLILAVKDNPNNPGQGVWTPSPSVSGAYPGVDLGRLLNVLGQQGWEATMAVDVGGGSRSEIILKKRL